MDEHDGPEIHPPPRCPRFAGILSFQAVMPGLNGLFISKRARAIHKFVKANRMCKGAGISGFCPKLILLLLALLPQFVHP